MAYVSTNLQKKYKEFTADGGCTNGEFTQGSVTTVLEIMEELGLTKDNVVVDCGCNYGYMCYVFAGVVGCSSYGIKIESKRSRIAMAAYLKIANDPELLILLSQRIAHIPGDLNWVDNYPSFATHVWMFDNAWPNSTVLHTYDKLAAIPGLKMIVTGKALKEHF